MNTVNFDMLPAGIMVLRIAIPAVYFLMAAGYLRAFVRNQSISALQSKTVFRLGLLFQTSLIVLLFLDQGGFPFGTVSKGLLFCTWILAGLLYAMKDIRSETSYGAFFFPLYFLVTSAACLFLDRGEPLPRAMMSHYFIIHASLLFIAYACFFLSFAISIMYLVQYYQIKSPHRGAIIQRMPSLDVMDHSVKLLDGLGLSLVIPGIIFGFLWLQVGVGISSNIHVKLGFIMLTSIVYLCEHMLRMTLGWKGKRACMISMIGFVLVICTLLVGRHGY